MLESEQDLVAAGYYVFVADYRLAPCGLIKGQTCHITDESSGRPPQQTNDVKAIMRAARADTHCNGFVGIVGGSAGGSHAAFVNLDRSVSADWPFWNNYRDDRPDAVVLLSGAYDFSDRTTEGYMPDPVKPFKDFIENYTNSCDLNYERSKSPVSLLSPSTADIKPMFLINSEMDTMPFHQIVDMENALQAAGVDSSLYKVLTVPDSSSHAFEYWREWDGIPPVGSEPEHDVGYHALQFLDQYLKP
jgi:acetyl esterase/lipase